MVTTSIENCCFVSLIIELHCILLIIVFFVGMFYVAGGVSLKCIGMHSYSKVCISYFSMTRAEI